MALLSLQNLHKAFGGPQLLDDATLQIERGERICLVGRNGEGKSTLLKIVSGFIEPDDGEIIRQPGIKIRRLRQNVPQDLAGTVEDLVFQGLEDPHDDWTSHQSVDKTISLVGLENEWKFNELSGGQKRRVLLAQSLVCEPDILVLDEPTNHLDIESIQWLENFLRRYKGTLLFVTHDRTFLRRLATRIVELDRGKLHSWACDYDTYLERKEALLNGEAEQWAQFDKKLAQEEVWIRKGIKARRTRNEGRVRELEKMRGDRSQRRERTGSVNMKLTEAGLSGRKVITVKDVSYDYDGLPIVKNLDCTVMRGDKIGIIGPNGCGKSTLLKLLLGGLQPKTGTVEHGTKLEVAYFDQHRAILDETKTVAENVCSEEFITIGESKKHVLGYLQDFLFTPDRARQSVTVLSGGERNRLLLAKLFTKASNVLVLDEPTNDLDAETLELLEDLLMNYDGTLLLVSHDRSFLNNVVTSTLVFEGAGQVNEYVGGYDDWLSQRQEALGRSQQAQPPEKQKTGRKLSNKERSELNSLPKLIEQLEAELETLNQTMADPSFYQQPKSEIAATTARAEEIPKKLEAAFERWEALERL
ncbi:MAG: ATP-binding cassette domain-containing protein [Kiritimatiellales bacterium]|nr:ATP-binding cassette domain-containing protein [Kiritimatiellales bacterium]MCF7863379.1 ATP-binding cassette domain-containing protein [Kiritimatiellales bacterium]